MMEYVNYLLDVLMYAELEQRVKAVDTLLEVCRLRAESARGQLEGRYPATLAQREDAPTAGVDASQVDLYALGDFADLEEARPRQDSALEMVPQRA